jgi:hypothetical protein
MCGLVAVFSKNLSGFTQEMRDTFGTLMLIDTLRGEDSTGAFMVRLNGDVDIAKGAITGAEFIKTKEYKKLWGDCWGQGAALIGHNRKATKGVVNDENAHPFVVDDQIVLVHNGGIFGDHKEHANVDVDSHAIAHLLHRHDTVEEALGKFYGAYALIWYDVEKEEVHIIRNKERPLWWMETENSWVWASEKAMLMFTAARCGLKIKVAPTMLEEDSLNTFTLKRGGGWSISQRKVEPQREWWDSTNNAKNEEGVESLMLPWKEQMDRHLAREEEEGIDPKDTRAEKGILSVPFLYTVGSGDWVKTSEFEREMAKKCNKKITCGEFNGDILRTYEMGSPLRCTCFEFIDDGDGGYFMYASPVDDQNLIVRHHFESKHRPTHERMMHMAVNEWVVDFITGPRCWSAFRAIEREDDHLEGYCMIVSKGATIIEGGPYKNGERKDVAYAH